MSSELYKMLGIWLSEPPALKTTGDIQSDDSLLRDVRLPFPDVELGGNLSTKLQCQLYATVSN